MELYSALWKETRGHVVPRRKARLPKDRLMQLAGIASEITLRKNLGKLRATGLVHETIIRGERGGNEYEVFQPEEIGLDRVSTLLRPSTPSTPSNPRQMLEGLDPLDARGSSPGAIVDSEQTSGRDKTLSLRPVEKADDEAFAGLRSAMAEATGREVTATALAELDELLTAEFKLASGRAESISAPGAFFAEHLRRRLWKKDKRQLEGEGESSADATAQEAKVDASKCPDCFGTGMWYPEGFEKGVARCGHDKL